MGTPCQVLPLTLNVRRQQPVLLRPYKPTPNHILSLSSLDNRNGLDFHVPVVQFYRRDPAKAGYDPRKVIADGLRHVLVDYYPFAGRLIHGHDGRLCVDCSAEGVLFIEAEGDACLADFGDIRPPFPCWAELLQEPAGSEAITDTPLLLMQVTLLHCGGFVLATRVNHVMCDAVGFAQFLNALGHKCKGSSPSAPRRPPVWDRSTFLPPRNPLVVSEAVRKAYKNCHIGALPAPAEDLRGGCVVFTRRNIARLKRRCPGAGIFEVVSACLWRSRTRALLTVVDAEPVRFLFPVNARRLLRLPVESGYYGNVIVYGCAGASAGELRKASLGEVARWIRSAMGAVDVEYVRSSVDAMELMGPPLLRPEYAFLVSDVRNVGLAGVDVGWGMPAFGGVASASVGPVPWVATFLNAGAEGSVVAAVNLPRASMAVFADNICASLAGEAAPLL